MARRKKSRKKKNYGGCRDDSGEFIPIPACTHKRKKRRR